MRRFSVRLVRGGADGAREERRLVACMGSKCQRPTRTNEENPRSSGGLMWWYVLLAVVVFQVLLVVAAALLEHVERRKHERRNAVETAI
jgi:hypothetical protein